MLDLLHSFGAAQALAPSHSPAKEGRYGVDRIPRNCIKGHTNVALLQICLVDNGLSHARVFEYMLAKIGVHLEYVIGGLRFRIWTALRR